MTYKRKKYHHGDTHLKKRWRVRNRKKDLDQIDEDIKEENADKLLNQSVDLDLPGAAQHYCLHCARYFINEQSLNEHFKTKVHKRRLKALELEPYTIEESERAAGHGSFKQASKRKILTQNTEKTDVDGDAIIEDVSSSKKKKQKEVLQNTLQRRRANIDLAKIENLWRVYEDLNAKKTEYTKQKDEIARELGKLVKNEPESDATKKLKMQSDLIKENIKKLKVPLWSAEEAAMVEALKLPNSLHSRTPDGKNKILYTHLSKPIKNKNHLNIGKKMNILDFKGNENYYLLGKGAVFELGAKFYFSKILKDKKFVQFSNPDFVKSLIIEGSGKDHTNPDVSFILHHTDDSKVNIDSRLHLTGGGSLSSFLAYHAKNVLYAKVLPLKYFTMGRQYTPSPSEEHSLFYASQSSVVEIFGVTKTEEDQDKFLEELIETLKIAYTKLGYHFRLSLVSADKLSMWESLRLSVEMFSTSLQDYVEVGNVSVSGDFISKRLMFTYVENKENKFPLLVSGTVLNVPKLFACALEQDAPFTVPDFAKIERYLYTEIPPRIPSKWEKPSSLF
ncbi:hypothetical protein PYW08_008054 [Mythimna loreyi]|uniref:Uncharacterized protein n=1 Tax=Mythimna loreyi TaxID=667449 RepID=A0ACC2QC80_9NEOP|nr:hypothetical protein PYW08_008054 [Mythimna loreyi]